ncbi:HAD hydrolase family protein [Tautonia sociabilis]|uniref:Uncharacterized protein n=1 Tax=Tautonia sociabilis TaxID=2080755 RepID=A0A432MF05_9BACT|nr:HAD hydrolase family protein [Tautonia sociabilis]RUL84341.1 hypothetical protein TsocGM_20660 [Tautonia sociabilis]
MPRFLALAADFDGTLAQDGAIDGPTRDPLRRLKASGLRAAMAGIGLFPRNVVSVGDAENDRELLRESECGVAVANAVPALAGEADWTTSGSRGEGVAERIDRLDEDDLAGIVSRLNRLELPIGAERGAGGRPFGVPPIGTTILIAGTSGAGRSAMVLGVLDRLSGRGYQFCVVDPEGAIAHQPGGWGIVLGGPDAPPCLLPASREPSEAPGELANAVIVTGSPGAVSPRVLGAVGQVWAVGDDPSATLREFAIGVGEREPEVGEDGLDPSECLAWPRRPEPAPPRVVRLSLARTSAKGAARR